MIRRAVPGSVAGGWSTEALGYGLKKPCQRCPRPSFPLAKPCWVANIELGASRQLRGGPSRTTLGAPVVGLLVRQGCSARGRRRLMNRYEQCLGRKPGTITSVQAGLRTPHKAATDA